MFPNRMKMAALVMGLMAFAGCSSTSPSPAPSIITDLTPIALQIAADDAYSSGAITAPQHTAATGIITELNTDLVAGNGTLTPAEITSLIEDAALQINAIYFPAPIASAARKPTTVEQAIHNSALAAKARLRSK